MSQTVLQAAQLLDVLTAKNEYVRAASDQRSLKIGVVNEWRSSLPEVNAVFEETLAKLSKSGMHIAEINLNSPTEKDGEDELTVLLSELDYEMQKYLSTRTGTRVKSLKDIISFNNEFSDQEMQYFGQEHFEKAIQISSDRNRYESARERNLKWAHNSLLQGLADSDVLIGCTYGPAWISSLGHGDKVDGGSWITMLAAIAGSPIGTLPMGLVSGLPVGLGLVVGKNQESKLISAMAQVERIISSTDLKPTFIK
jgi:amidase